MSAHELEPLAPHLQALLDRERPLLSPPSGEQAQVLAAIEAAVAAGVVTAAGASASGALATGAQTAAGIKAFFASKLIVGVVMFALGGASGAALASLALHVWPPPLQELPRPAAPTALAAAPAVVVPLSPVAPAPSPAPEPARPAPTAPTTPTAPTAPQRPAAMPARPSGRAPADPNRGLAEEAGILRQAQETLGRQPAEALSLVDLHAERFPEGQLVQEREALRVQALVSAGRFDEACRAGAEFERRFPESLSLPSVRKALASLPQAPPLPE
ncbi:MAG TPA: hypothetical protein VGK67_19070 [Myxococcales bacterium]|jgi:hypothetical protein